MTALAGLLAGVVMAQGLTGIGPAVTGGTSVQLGNGQLVISASPGAVNHIVVTAVSQTLRVADAVPVQPGPGCTGVTPTEVSCQIVGVRSVLFHLGDGDDTAEFDVFLPALGSGDAGNDQIWGTAGDDSISGGVGTDSLHGGAGVDTLYGGSGMDTLFGGTGDDTLYGDDVVPEPACVSLVVPCSDQLVGEDGDDYLDGGDGGDSLKGGAGNDVIVGSGLGMRDMAIYDDRTDAVGVNLSTVAFDDGSVSVPAGSAGTLVGGVLVETDTLTGVHDVRTGSGNDILIGPGDGPILSSGEGADLCDVDASDGIVLKDC